MSYRLVRSLSVLLLFSSLALSQAPPGYYDPVDTSTPAALRATLHDVIDDHVRFPYTSSATDTWDILEQADEDPGNANNILDVYRNASYAKEGGGNSFYNREHTWPKSYGFPNDNSSNYPYTDCHHLFLCDSGYNSSRSNKPYRYCSASCTEKTTEVNNGAGGGSGTYPGNSSWTSGSFTAGTWETWIDRRGDVARALLYLDVRYEGGTHGVTGVSEPDLILTDDEALIASSNTGSNESVGYMGMLTVLLQWHQEDPVDAKEMARNDAIFAHQGNRNPFIDHPEWVDCLFSAQCGGDTTPPAQPTGLAASAGDGFVDLVWSANGEPDLDGYNVYRSTSSGGPYSPLNGALVTTEGFTDATVTNGTTYHYVVSAVDTSGNESALSAEEAATPMGGGGGSDPWINEFHYDDSGKDGNEFVEVAGPAGTDLSGWTVVGYNGSNGTDYKTESLSGAIPDLGSGFGVVDINFKNMQNGSPDGLALVDAGGFVVQFLSYEGAFTATSGPANGMTSTDIGVAESGSTPNGSSLQLSGTGSVYGDFSWQGPQGHTRGAANVGQFFGGGSPTPPAAPTGLVATAGDGLVDLAWNANGEPDLDGYDVHRSTSSGGPYTTLNGPLVTTESFSDTTAQNGTTYYYVVTAINTAAQESGFSNEDSATPVDTTPPAPPTGLVATGGDGQVSLDWDDNGETDLAGYDVFRATSSGGPYTQLNGGLLGSSNYVDTTVTNGTTYYYVVRAEDVVGNASADSNESAATPQAPGGGGTPWINELHYDNQGGDVNEFVEIAAPAGTDLAGWSLVLYNGNNGRDYATISLSGVIANQTNGYGFATWFQTLQNGAPDGLALVDPAGTVTEFLSYEGSFTAVRGPASGLTSTDMGVSEPSNNPVGFSLQRAGTGSGPGDFTWQPPQADTPGAVNTGQTLQ